MNTRIAKINELVKNHINEIITRDLNLKSELFITISKVDTSPDLRYTQVFISIFPETEIPYATKTLEKEMFRIQGKLNKKLHMRPLPKVRFSLDTTEIEADKIEKLLKKLQ